jgi:hypothetical protein
MEPLTLHAFPRAIVHIDGDAFFASCEQSRREETGMLRLAIRMTTWPCDPLKRHVRHLRAFSGGHRRDGGTGRRGLLRMADFGWRAGGVRGLRLKAVIFVGPRVAKVEILAK